MYFASSGELQKVLYFGQKFELFSKKGELKKRIIWLGATCRPADVFHSILSPPVQVAINIQGTVFAAGATRPAGSAT